MNRKVLAAHYIISVVFLLAIVGLGAYRLLGRAEVNLLASRRRLEALRITALSTYLTEGGFDSDTFRSRMSESLRATERLRLLAVYSEDEGLHYLLSRSRRLLGAEPQELGQREGAPDYELIPLLHVRLSVPFSPGIRSGLVMEGVFLRLDREDLYPVLRELLLLLVVYLGITTVLLLAAALSRPAPPGALSRGRPARRAERRRLGPPEELENPAAPPGSAHAGAGLEWRRRPDNSGLYAPDTGLGWRDFLPERLTHELERAASFDQDLTLLLAGIRPVAPADSVNRAGYLYRQLARYTLESFPLKDLAFEYDSHAVAVILPERSLDRGLEEAKSFQRKLLEAPWPGAEGVQAWAGLSSRSGRLVSGTRLLIEAGRALKKAESGAAGQIVAFRADARRFRQALSAARGR